MIRLRHLSSRSIEAELLETSEVEQIARDASKRFDEHVREVDINLLDVNGPKGGVDKMCVIRFRLKPRGLGVVRGVGRSFIEAASVAADKLSKCLRRHSDRKLTKRRRHRWGVV